ncbi:Nicotinate-nucleotide adenylyltransferase [bioreactor metagenome]|uniref:Nicotinate-nucleotide adenylyltransferase n=1 Tax=bioreactor metagenome TaxID=1076179 RepID=A0A645CPH0_9ZZZZ
MKKIGLFGGTFSPIHLGHITIAECFMKKCDLEICFFIPAKKSPFKLNQTDMFSDIERCQKIEEAISTNPCFKLSKFELENTDVSYTINTVLYFHKIYNDAQLFLLIGSDQAIKFHLWKDYKKILELVTVVIATRPEKINDNEQKQIESNFENHQIILLNNKIIDITSTKIREMIKNKTL